MIELAPGAAIGDGRYKLERLLGAGGMASVWLARDGRLGRQVAVKLLSDVLALDPSYVERFRREAQIAARLWHPNLVQVYDFDVDGGRPLLVMEFVQGASLADVLGHRAERSLQPRRLASELLAALAHIHDAGVVHRDIKPGNVLLGEDGRVRLTDFGIAQPNGATRLTLPGGVIGTAGYLAPEVLRGDRATPRSDLYSCGLVLAACCDGRPRDPRLAHVIDALTAENPARRLRSATAALALLEDQSTSPSRSEPAPTAVMPERPRARTDPRRPAMTWLLERPLRAALAGFAVGLVLLAIILALASGGGGASRAPGPARATSSAASGGGAGAGIPPPSAPLAAQLNALGRDLDAAARG